MVTTPPHPNSTPLQISPKGNSSFYIVVTFEQIIILFQKPNNHISKINLYLKFLQICQIISIGPTPKGWISKFVFTKIFETLSRLTVIDWEAQTLEKMVTSLLHISAKCSPS